MRVISSSDGTSRSSKFASGLRMPLLIGSDDLTKAESDRGARHTESVPNYLPFAERRPSTQYQDMLRTIRDDGVRVQTKQGEDALAVAGCVDALPDGPRRRGDHRALDQGLRRKAIGELCAFINGARTLDELRRVRLRLVGRLGDAGEDRLARPGAGRPRPRLLRARVPQLHDRPRRRRPGLRPAPAPDPEAARPAAGPHRADEPVDPAGQPPRRRRQVAQHDRAVPRLDPRAGARRQAAPASTTSAPATRRSACRPTWRSTPRWA